MKRVCILGSTGSIGVNSLKVIKQFEGEMEVVALSCYQNITKLAEQVEKYRPQQVAIVDSSKISAFKARCRVPVEVLSGVDGLVEIVKNPDINTIITAVVGAAGLLPTIRGIQESKNIAIANKETLVIAGELVMQEARRHGVSLLPVDSEHSAIHQCLHHRQPDEIQKLILTASGGPFRTLPATDFEKITVEDALNHPTWNMGAKITIDSATLMNKGLEVIEAHWLFGVDVDRVEVLVHPQSIIHSMVEFVDGSIMAQLGSPDMKLPIQYALTYPYHRAPASITTDFVQLGQLTFEAPDMDRFPCLRLAYEAARAGGTFPAVLNAANEIAVNAFLNRQIRFIEIPQLIETTMKAHQNHAHPTLAEILHADQWARDFTQQTI
ncbi:MAG: 1-deoxy-D-xylulose-5-phosphate reductoisomerase [Gemmatimonadetes bacterium]|nr:MAG: 1-deoxy-D-xylulose-5-phosphate reductoisomerase [Gemmatimonadota bacterium]